MTKEIYQMFDVSFRDMSAYAVLHNGDYVGRVCTKGKMAYCHWIGTRMQRGVAKGGGYDLISAACSSAADNAYKHAKTIGNDMGRYEDLFWDSLKNNSGTYWNRRLTNNGFTVIEIM